MFAPIGWKFLFSVVTFCKSAPHMVCAGGGGSLRIIGSAAGVVAMVLEKIEFGWYLRKITLLALAGYFAGMLVIFLEHLLLG